MDQPTLLPQPWRLVFNGIENLHTNSALYQRLSGLADGGTKVLGADLIDRWAADQDKAEFEAELVDGRKLRAKFEFLGTHDGNDFCWADANPSIRRDLTTPASRLRTNLPKELAAFGKADRPKITRRETLVFVGLVSEIIEDRMWVVLPSRSSLTALALSEVQHEGPDAKGRRSRPGILSRFFSKTKVQSGPPSIEEQLATFRQSVGTALNQWQRNLLPTEELRRLEPDLIRAHDAMLSEKPGMALTIIADLKSRMGPYPMDQEPTGWVYLCEGLAATATGDRALANKSFTTALRAVVPVSNTSLRIAWARANDGNVRHHYLKTAYILSPERFVSLASPDEVSVIKLALAAIAQERDHQDPKSVLVHVIREMCAIEISAATRSEAASAERTNRNTLCDADRRAEWASNSEYAEFILTWATTGRSPSLASYSSTPDYDPDLIDRVEAVSRDPDTAVFLVTFKTLTGTRSRTARYTLRRVALPLSERHQWRLDKIATEIDGKVYPRF
jgi:hypothetical protein